MKIEVGTNKESQVRRFPEVEDKWVESKYALTILDKKINNLKVTRFNDEKKGYSYRIKRASEVKNTNNTAKTYININRWKETEKRLAPKDSEKIGDLFYGHFGEDPDYTLINYKLSKMSGLPKRTWRDYFDEFTFIDREKTNILLKLIGYKPILFKEKR